MVTVLLSMLIFLLAVLGLALGVIVNRRPIGGSCGDCADCLCRRRRT